MFKISPSFIKQIKLFLFPAVTIFLILILTVRFLLPKIEETQAIFSKNSKDKETLNSLENKAKKLTDLKNSTLTVDFQKAEAVLPSDKNIPQIFASLNQLERVNGVQLEDLSLKPGILSKDTVGGKKGGANLENLVFSVSLVGNETSVLAFAENLLKNAPLFNINSVTLTGSGGTFRLVLGLTTYYQNLPETLGKVNSPLPELSEPQKKALALIQSFSFNAIPIEAGTSASSPSGGLTGKSIFDL